MANVLFFDIETAPNLSYTWGKWQQNVIEFEREWYMLCCTWKWAGEDVVHYAGINEYDLYDEDPEDDFAVVEVLYKLLEKADIVIAHNGDKFDVRKANTRFIYHDTGPPVPYLSVDTLKIARKYFKFESNSLNDLAQYLGLGRKVRHPGFPLWKGCMTGDLEMWEKMEEYALQDIVLLEKVYEKVLPWADCHPNMANITGNPMACSKCGVVGHLINRGIRYTKTMKYPRYSCNKCHGFSTGIRSFHDPNSPKPEVK